MLKKYIKRIVREVLIENGSDIPDLRNYCDYAISNGKGEISYHDWNVLHSEEGRCAYCSENKTRGKLHRSNPYDIY